MSSAGARKEIPLNQDVLKDFESFNLKAPGRGRRFHGRKTVQPLDLERPGHHALGNNYPMRKGVVRPAMLAKDHLLPDLLRGAPRDSLRLWAAA